MHWVRHPEPHKACVVVHTRIPGTLKVEAAGLGVNVIISEERLG